MERPNRTSGLQIHLYDMLLAMSMLSLVAAVVPNAVYLKGLAEFHIRLDGERAAGLLQQLRWYAPILTIVASALWWVTRRLATEIRASFDFNSRIAAWLLPLHFLLFVPTIAFGVYYGAYWLATPESRWREEVRVVPWHRDLPDVVMQLRQQIPKDASVLLILEQPGTISYAAYFNAYLYPRKVYIHRRSSDQGRIMRADVDVGEMRDSGIGWIITYSGPRVFEADQLRVEPIL